MGFVLAQLLLLLHAALAVDIIPFQIKVSEMQLRDLSHRLSLSRWSPSLLDGDDANVLSPTFWKYGANPAYLKELVHYWRTKFDWSQMEYKLNQFPQFTVSLPVRYADSIPAGSFNETADTLNIHFIHARSSRPNAYALLFSHGWPGSFAECTKIIPLLTEPVDPSAQAFHVVCPSLPGYGFSEAPKKKGFHTARVAEVFARLMHELGYEQYIAQGGDWGSLITTQVALQDPQHCTGIHINLFLMEPPFRKGVWSFVRTLAEYVAPSWFLSAEEYKRLDNMHHYLLDGSGYLIIQATKPQTIGYALHDSPVGLAAYLVEKFHAWTDVGPDGILDNSFSKDDLLTNIMIYWVSESISTSMRLYYEELHRPDLFDWNPKAYVQQPTGYSSFPGEISRPPRRWIESYYNIISFTEMPRGGHFAAFQVPELLVEDIRLFFSKMQPPQQRRHQSSNEL